MSLTECRQPGQSGGRSVSFITVKRKVYRTAVRSALLKIKKQISS